MDSSSETASVDQSPSGTTIGDALPLAKTASAIWNSVVVLPMPGGATRIRSSSVVSAIANADALTGSLKPSTSSVRAMAVDGHLSERRKTSRSAATALRRRALSSSTVGACIAGL